MEERGRLPVSLPHDKPTQSYWQEVPADIADLRTTDELPSHADTVIIGSGISGACIAYNLLSRQPGRRVVMLEARQACSGATGRNGGHTKAASYRSFLEHERELGIDEAVKIVKTEYANIKETHVFAREHGIDCASLECETVDVIYSQKSFDKAVEAISRMREVLGDHPAGQYSIHDADKTHERFMTTGAIGSITYAAGSLSAYDFTFGVLKLALDRGLNLQTGTTVTRIQDDEKGCTITTSRGTVNADSVVVASNGYTARVLPEMQGLIVPLQGQVVAQRPGLSLPQHGLQTTYSFIYETGYEYMITRPQGYRGEGHIIIGGGIHKLPESGASRYGNIDDSELEPTITTYLRDCTRTSFAEHWGSDHESGRIVQEWSGIMGATADGLPYVGKVPHRSSVFIAAGFNGHGMVLCLKAAEALTSIMLDDEVQAWFPKSMLITKERLKVKFAGRKDLIVPGEPQFQERSHT